ncbi:MAG: NlpC/P60 family protein [Firmicutes bacterium]|nr:NlpC/P60 family protein [Bacillota bacterium]
MTIDATSLPALPGLSQIQSFFNQMQAPSTTGGLSSSASVTNPFEILLSGESASGSSASSGSQNASASAQLGGISGLPATLQTAINSGGSASGIAIVQAATNELGVPYVWGGSAPSTGFDCSGLVQYVFSTLGVSLPRTAAEQEQVGTPVASMAQAQPGDLLFFEPGQNGAPPGEAGHVAIYIGNGQMIAAPQTGQDVQVQPVPTTPLAIRRITVPVSGSSLAQNSASGSISPQLNYSGSTLPASAAVYGGSSGVQMIGGVPVPLQYVSDIENASSSTGVPASLISAILYNESRFNPAAVSSAGAEGIAQFMPGTAAANNVNPWNPASAIQGEAQLLAGFHSAFGNWSDAIAAYAAGGAAVEAAGGIPQVGNTAQYVQSVLSLAQMGAGS